jgi:hypothetical protein
MSDAIETLKAAKVLIAMGMVNSADKAIDMALQALQSGEPVVPTQWRVVMRGMIEYAECNDPGNPYLPQAQALLSAGKENNNANPK